MSDTSWNLQELRAFVAAHRKNDPPLLQYISSIDRGVQIFQYHLASARDALNGVLNLEEPQSADNYMLLLGGHPRQEAFYQAKLVRDAHLLAAAHTARDLLEAFAQLINGIALQGAVGIKACSLKRVTRELSHGELKTALKAILESSWFLYLDAFVNTVKHRQLVQHAVTISCVEDQVGVQICAFEYEGRTYPTYWSREFLEGILSVKNAIVGAGQLLNRVAAQEQIRGRPDESHLRASA